MIATALTTPAVSFVDAWLAPRVGERPVASGAGWVDDLGLRHFDSAGRAQQLAWLADRDAVAEQLAELEVVDARLAALAAELGVDVSHAEAWMPELGDAIDLHEVGRLLARLVDELGAWPDAARLAAEVLDQLDEGSVEAAFVDHAGAVTALVRMGNVLAVEGDPRCLDAFDLVARLAPAPADRALARFRALVALVKRLDAPAATVDGGFAQVDAAMLAVPRNGDRRLLAALVGNLRALTHMRARDRAAAWNAVHDAWQQVASDELALDAFDPDFLDEVRLQVLANVATVTGASGDWGRAAQLLADGVRIAERRGSAPKLLEALTLHGYALWNAGDIDAARDVLHAADAVGHELGPVTQRAQAWKLLAVLEHDAGNEQASAEWLARIHLDGAPA